MRRAVRLLFDPPSTLRGPCLATGGKRGGRKTSDNFKTSGKKSSSSLGSHRRAVYAALVAVLLGVLGFFSLILLRAKDAESSETPIYDDIL